MKHKREKIHAVAFDPDVIANANPPKWREPARCSYVPPLAPPEKRALEYIENAGGNPLIIIFDEDHEPIGPMLRDQLCKLNLVEEIDGHIRRRQPK